MSPPLKTNWFTKAPLALKAPRLVSYYLEERAKNESTIQPPCSNPNLCCWPPTTFPILLNRQQGGQKCISQ